MRASARIVTFALALAMSGCINHGSSYDPGADFKSYKTWAWITDDAILKTQAVISGFVVHVNPLAETYTRGIVETSGQGELARVEIKCCLIVAGVFRRNAGLGCIIVNQTISAVGRGFCGRRRCGDLFQFDREGGCRDKTCKKGGPK